MQISSANTPISVAYGDGIGPEIMRAVLRALAASGARLDIQPIEIGATVYSRGHQSGIAPSAWENLRRTRVLLKAPISTPQGGGYKSVNVTLRKTLGLFANVRPAIAYHPFVATKHPAMDVVIVRENEEDLYAGIEHQQTDDVVQCLKLISRPGTERIVRYAFEYARAHGRHKVSCFTKDNIMKMTDGLFHRIFDEIASEYPEIANEHLIVDIGAAMLVDRPELFDVVVVPNLYGDILSDITAEIAGSVGLAGSANIGEQGAMFEAIHGTAPGLAGKDAANPSGLLTAGIMMLNHIGQFEAGTRLLDAWLKTIEDGIHTPDIWHKKTSSRQVGTQAFANAVIDRLGKAPATLRRANQSNFGKSFAVPKAPVRPPKRKELVGIDLFVHWRGEKAQRLAAALTPIAGNKLALTTITNRSIKVWPDGQPETLTTDHWRCRFMKINGSVDHGAIADMLRRAADAGIDFIKTEHLCTFDDQPGYSAVQGQ